MLSAYVRAMPIRLWRSLATVPTGRDVIELGLAAALVAAVVGPAGFATGLLTWRPRPGPEVLRLAAAALLAPGLGEEAPFRGALVPDRREAISPALPILLSTGVFSLWHLVEATTFLPRARPLFLRADFLAWTVLLGLVCAVLRRRSGSLWPAVLLHWAAVVAWQGWLGGPGAAELR
jgi:predicted Abi (CAAX) family protease